MTFKEKLAQEHPECVHEDVMGGCCDCPYDYGYEKEQPEFCKGIFNATDERCSMCWNREIPKFTKADLKTGHIVTLRNGAEYMVVKDIDAMYVDARGDAIVGINNPDWEHLESYSENLLCRGDDFYRNLDIMKVEKLEHPIQFVIRTDTANRTLLWERKEHKEMTVVEIEKARPSCCNEFSDASDEMCTTCWNRDIPNIETVPKENPFTKSDLKVGHVVEYRNGKRRLVYAEENNKFLLFMGTTTYESASIYDNNLLCKGDHNFDIMKVYVLKDSYITSGNVLDVKFNLIWKREEVREISISDAEIIIEEATGKKVKIVKE